MARQATVGDNENEGQSCVYTIIESLEDIGSVFCFAPESDLIECFNEGKIIMINGMGGYCFFTEGYHVEL